MRQDGDLKTFRRRRESELKNGRVAMFAAMGCFLAVKSWKNRGGHDITLESSWSFTWLLVSCFVFLGMFQ